MEKIHSKKRNIIIIFGALCALLFCFTASLAIFMSKRSSTYQLDINPIVITQPLEKEFTARMNADMIGKNILANDICFTTSPTLEENIYVRCAILATTNNVDLGASIQYQDTYVATTDGTYTWEQYKDYYYLFKNGKPAVLSSSDAGTVYEFLDNDTLLFPDFVTDNFFDSNNCTIDFKLEAIDASLITGAANTASQVEAVSSTPVSTQTQKHTVKFFDCNGTQIKQVSNLAHGASITAQVPSVSTINMPIGYEFVGWNTQYQLRGATFTSAKLNNIVMDVNLYPVVELQRFDITVTQPQHGVISPSTTTVKYNDSLTFFITAEEGYKVSDVLVDGVSVGAVNSYSFNTITQDHTISAVIAPRECVVSVKVEGPGSATPLTQTISYNGNGEDIIFTPQTGCYISSLKLNGVEQGESGLNATATQVLENITSDLFIEVVFANGLFSITVDQISNCTITPTITDIIRGENKTITITPASGYRIVKYIVDGNDYIPTINDGDAGTYEFTNITTNHTFSAVVEQNIYQITASVNNSTAGSVSPANIVSNPGENKTITITANYGYEIFKITDNGQEVESIPTQTSYVLTNVRGNHDVIVYFTESEFSVYATIASNFGSVSSLTKTVTGPANKDLLIADIFNSVVSMTITPNNGYAISAITLYEGSSLVGTDIELPSNPGDSKVLNLTLRYDYHVEIEFVQHIFTLDIKEVYEKTDGTYSEYVSGDGILDQDKNKVSGDGLVGYNAPISLTVQPALGFEFKGYYSDSACQTVYEIPEVMPNSNLTVYAKFSRVEYLLKFEEMFEEVNGNARLGNAGGTITPKEQMIKFGCSLSAPTIVANPGFEFDGYYLNSSILPANEISLPQTMPANATVIYAYFARLEVSLTIDPNGGSYNNSSSNTIITGKVGSSHELMTPERTGYVFMGWSEVGNLFNTAQLVSTNNYINNNGSLSSNSEYQVYRADINPSTVYTIINSGLSTAPGYAIYDSNNNWVDGAKYNNNSTVTFTTPNNASYIKFSVNYNSSNRQDIDYFSLFAGTLSPLSNAGMIGENLFSTATIVNAGYYIRGNGTLTAHGAYSVLQSDVEGISTLACKNSGQSNSPGYAFFDKYNNFITGSNYSNRATINITVPSNAKYIRYSVNYGDATESYRIDSTTFEMTVKMLSNAVQSLDNLTYGSLDENNVFTFGTSNVTLKAIWEKATYTLTIFPNGGYYNDNSYDIYDKYYNISIAGEYGSTYTLNNPVHPDAAYEFSEWELSSEIGGLSGNVFTFGAGDSSVRAKWTGLTFEFNVVEYFENVNGTYSEGTTGGSVSGDGELPPNSTIALVVNTNTGFTFAGYYSDAGLSSPASLPSIMPNSNKTYYAKFTRNQYTLNVVVTEETANGTFNSEGTISGSTLSIITAATNKVVVNATTLKFGAPISATITNAQGFSSAIYPNSSYINATSIAETMPANDLTYYVRFTRSSYALTIEPNGGSYNNLTSNSVVNGKFGASVNIATPVRLGYTFDGWNIANIASGTLSGITFTFGVSNSKITAKWVQINYTLNIDAAGGTYNDQYSVVESNHHYGDVVSLLSPIRSGYDFVKWIITDGRATLSGLSLTFVDSDVTIRADWKEKTYKVTVNEMYESTTAGSYTTGTTGGRVDGGGTYSYATSIVLVATPSAGFEFGGYYSNSSLSTLVSASDRYTFSLTSEVTLYAKFTRITYTMTVNPNGGTWRNLTGNQTVSAKFGQSVTVDNPVREGYTFQGWNQTGSGTLTGTTFTFGSENVTLTARWEKIVCQLTLIDYTEMDDGTHATGSIGGRSYFVANNTSTITVDYGTLVEMTSTNYSGYIFDGYYETFASNVFSSLLSKNLTYSITPVQSMTIYTKFIHQRVDITLNANLSGATGSSISLGASDVVSNYVNYVPTGSVVDNYTFLGWNTSANGSGTYVGNMLSQVTQSSRFRLTYFDYNTGYEYQPGHPNATVNNYGLLSNEFGIIGGNIYTLFDYGNYLPSIFVVIYNTVGNRIMTINNSNRFVSSENGKAIVYIALEGSSIEARQDGASNVSCVNSMICSIGQDTVGSLLDSNSPTELDLYAQWRQKLNSLTINIWTVNPDGTMTESTTGGTTKAGGATLSATTSNSITNSTYSWTMTKNNNYYVFGYYAIYQNSQILFKQTPFSSEPDSSLIFDSQVVNSIQDGFTAKNYSCYIDQNIVLNLVYASVVVLDQNGGSGGSVSAPAITYSNNYNYFALSEPGQSAMNTKGGLEFYYYAPENNCSASIMPSTRYDLGSTGNITYSIPLSTQNKFILYATYLTPNTSDSTEGIVVSYGTTTLRGRSSSYTYKPLLISYTIREYYNGLNFKYSVTGHFSKSQENRMSAKYITFPREFRELEYDAISGMSRLESISFPTYGFTTLDSTFASKSFVSTANFVVPNSVTSIDNSAFSGANMGTITLGTSVTESMISDNLFDNLSNLSAIYVDVASNNLSSVDGVLYNNNKTKLIRVPEKASITDFTMASTCTSIGSHAIYQCSSVTSVTLSQNMTFISDSIAKNSSLSTISATGKTLIFNSNSAYSNYATLNINASVINFAGSDVLKKSSTYNIKYLKLNASSKILLAENSLQDIPTMYQIYLGAVLKDISNNNASYTLSNISDCPWVRSASENGDGDEVTSINVAGYYHKLQSDDFFEWVIKGVNYTYGSNLSLNGGSTATKTSSCTPSSAVIIGYRGDKTDLTVPDVLYYDNVTYIITEVDGLYDCVDNSCNAFTKVTMGSNVTTIGASNATKSIFNVGLNDSAYTSMGANSINFVNVGTINPYAFCNCSEFNFTYYSSANFANVVIIGDHAFAKCTSLRLPNIRTPIIGDYAFSGCTNLVGSTGILFLGNFSIGLGLVDFGKNNYLIGITSIDVASYPIVVGDHAFDGCTDIKHFRLSNSGEYTLGAYCLNGTTADEISGNANKVLFNEYALTGSIVATISLSGSSLCLKDNCFYDSEVGILELHGTYGTIGNNAFNGIYNYRIYWYGPMSQATTQLGASVNIYNGANLYSEASLYAYREGTSWIRVFKLVLDNASGGYWVELKGYTISYYKSDNIGGVETYWFVGNARITLKFHNAGGAGNSRTTGYVDGSEVGKMYAWQDFSYSFDMNNSNHTAVCKY